MKRIENKYGYIEYEATWEELHGYILGCISYADQKKVIVRTKGFVKDLKYILIKKDWDPLSKPTKKKHTKKP